jgi:hypothetical protein
VQHLRFDQRLFLTPPAWNDYKRARKHIRALTVYN